MWHPQMQIDRAVLDEACAFLRAQPGLRGAWRDKVEFTENNPLETNHNNCVEVYRLFQLLTKVQQKVPGAIEKIFPHFYSDKSWDSQLLVIAFLSEYFEILDVERPVLGGSSIDIVISVDGVPVNCHVGRVGQDEKFHELFVMSSKINFRAVREDRPLMLKNIYGILGDTAKANLEEIVFLNFPSKPGLYQYKSPNPRSPTGEPDVVTLEFDLRVKSGHGQIGGIDPFRNLPQKLKDTEDKIITHLPDSINLFIAVTNDLGKMPTMEVSKYSLDGLVFLFTPEFADVNGLGYEITRSDIEYFHEGSHLEIIEKIENELPKRKTFIINSSQTSTPSLPIPPPRSRDDLPHPFEQGCVV